MRSKILAALVVLIVAMSGMTVFADAPQLDTPENEIDIEEYQNVNQASSTLTISGGTAKSGIRVSGKTQSTSISATLYLQKYNSSTGTWTNVKTWNIPQSKGSLSASKSKSVGKGKYRTKAAIKASGESITIYSSTKTY